jgi:hypothetical protein
MIAPLPTFPATASVDQRIAGVKGLISQLKKSGDRPILVGPWRSELGFEVLYWLPFLRWLSAQVPKFDQRACVLTRGGLAQFYASVASKGHDLYALRSVKDVRRENLADYKQTALQKQIAMTEWDQVVLDDAAKACGIGPVYDVVHPAWMYWALTPFWEDHAGMRYLTSLTAFDPLPKPARPEGLPEKYVAVKFYGRATFPYPEPEVSQFIQRIVGTMAAQIPVVVVPGGAYDDHVDVPLTGPNIISVADLKPETNLYSQAAVMAHATAVVGTYGGTMQMALRMGVPSVSFWKEFGGTARAHLALSQWLSVHSRVPFLTGSITETGLWQQVCGQLVLPVAQMQQVPAHEISKGR